MTSLKDIKEQIIKIKTDITDIDIAESKIQLISLQLNPREGEKEPTEPKREKEPTEPKRERRNLLNPREREGTNRTQEREKEPTEPKRREKEPTELKRERAVRSPLKQCITADKPPYQRVSSESRQAHSHRIPSFPIAIP